MKQKNKKSLKEEKFFAEAETLIRNNKLKEVLQFIEENKNNFPEEYLKISNRKINHILIRSDMLFVNKQTIVIRRTKDNDASLSFIVTKGMDLEVIAKHTLDKDIRQKFDSMFTHLKPYKEPILTDSERAMLHRYGSRVLDKVNTDSFGVTYAETWREYDSPTTALQDYTGCIFLLIKGNHIDAVRNLPDLEWNTVLNYFLKELKAGNEGLIDGESGWSGSMNPEIWQEKVKNME